MMGMIGVLGNTLMAQTARGTVTDAANGDPLIGVNVVIKGTATGTVTDLDGAFSLDLTEMPSTLVLSYTGYRDQEVTVSSTNSPIQVALQSGVVLQDITVTARRVEESLQSVPLAITAFTPEELVQKGATQINDIARFTPGLTIENGQSGAAFGTSIFIRGIGQSDFKGTTDPGVGVYVDGIYIARTIGTLFEMEGAQVEILRGPQGTTFGRNTIGGAINITTPNPTTDKVYGTVEATAGNYSLAQIRGSVNLPISEKVAANFSTVYRKRGSFTERLLDPDTPQGDDNTFFLRGKLNAIPTDNLVLDFGFDYTRTRAGSAVSTVVDANPQAYPFALIYNALVGDAVDQKWITGDPYKTNATGASVNDLDVFGVNGSAKLDLGSVTSKLVVGYRNMDSQFSRDGDNGPFPYRHTNGEFNSVSTSAELQFFNSKPSKFNWLGGLYYMTETNEDFVIVDLATGLFAALNAAASPDEVPGPGPFGGPGNPANVGLDLNLDVQNTVVIDNFAAFLNLSYDLTDKFSVSGGLRYSKDDKAYTSTHQKIASQAYIVPPDTRVAADWTSVTGRVSAEFQATDKILTYASYANGFKGGGFNARPLRSAEGIQPFAPEKVNTFELGFKSDIGDKTRLNISAYLSDYTDIQVGFVNTPEIVVENAAKAEIKGIEAEFLTSLGEDFHVNASASFTDAAFTEIEESAQLTTESVMQKTPSSQFAIGASYTPAIGDNARLGFRVDFNTQSDTYHNAANTPVFLQPAYSMVSARVGVTLKEKYEISLWGKNLTDQAVIQSGITSAAFGISDAFYGAPRTVGASFRLKF